MKHKFNYLLFSSMLKVKDEHVKELAHNYREAHDEAMSLEGQLITARDEAMRLRHENEFMLKLIDKYMQEHGHETDT